MPFVRLSNRSRSVIAGAAIGAEGMPALGPLALEALAEAPRLALVGTRRIGDDVLTRWERT